MSSRTEQGVGQGGGGKRPGAVPGAERRRARQHGRVACARPGGSGGPGPRPRRGPTLALAVEAVGGAVERAVDGLPPAEAEARSRGRRRAQQHELELEARPEAEPVADGQAGEGALERGAGAARPRLACGARRRRDRPRGVLLRPAEAKPQPCYLPNNSTCPTRWALQPPSWARDSQQKPGQGAGAPLAWRGRRTAPPHPPPTRTLQQVARRHAVRRVPRQPRHEGGGVRRQPRLARRAQARGGEHAVRMDAWGGRGRMARGGGCMDAPHAVWAPSVTGAAGAECDGRRPRARAPWPMQPLVRPIVGSGAPGAARGSTRQRRRPAQSV
jgi:hypothetical protein